MDYKSICTRLEEIESIRRTINQKRLVNKEIIYEENIEYVEGVSVIVPTYKGENHILKCLISLTNQSLHNDLFEIIIIINGEKDNTKSIVENYINKNEISNIKILQSDIPSAGNARNIGIEVASRKFITFVDDDDYISYKFLEELYNNSSENRIVISQIIDVDYLGEENKFNSINKQILKYKGEVDMPLKNINMILTINACKLMPTKLVKRLKYDVLLRSGEDVVFYSQLISNNNFKYYVLEEKNNAIYYRVLRDNSVSRKKMIFGFNVIERLEVISRLDRILDTTTQENKKMFIKQKINAQALFINRYLLENQSERTKILSNIKKYNINYIPYNIINRGIAKDLVIAYCFPPYIDTSGNVMAKRIREEGKVVDVIFNNNSKIRKLDNRLNILVEDIVENKIQINSYASFSNWKSIRDFCDRGISEILKIERSKGKYESVYSRIMFPASHFLAFEYKLMNPEVKWVAEFSDPILFDINSNIRNSEINDQIFINKVKKNSKMKHDISLYENNLFFLGEYIPYVFADEIIFTNKNQMEYMVENFPIDSMKEIIIKKAIIKKQPTLEKSYYDLVKTDYKINQKKTNFAYFGSFYETRNLDDVINAFLKIDQKYNKQYNIHIFTNDPKAFYEKVSNEYANIIDNFKVNAYVSFLEFLNLTTKFDCLIVNDAVTIGIKEVNPYLPSKLSDYIGSGTPVWGICEQDSTMHKYGIAYKSLIGDIPGGSDILEAIIKDKMNYIEEKIY